MERIELFGLDPDPNEDAPRSRLVFRGELTPQRVAGVTLEAQFRINDKYLLLVTEDVPYEEALHVYLLDDRLRILDELELSNTYTPGILRDLRVIAADELEFAFFGEDRWRLQVYDAPRRRLIGNPFAPVKRLNRSLFAARYIDLTRSTA